MSTQLEDLNERFSLGPSDGSVVRCDAPGCNEEHVANWVLYDHAMRARVPFPTREAAITHAGA